jgi:cytochrome c heme-lyase
VGSAIPRGNDVSLASSLVQRCTNDVRCGGPKLESFANKMDRMTPTARFKTMIGYTAPFDRHDWVIDRCGTRVDYVIDFYSGRPNGSGGPSFYLDVRPKLNTWEGVKMRAKRWAFLA